MLLFHAIKVSQINLVCQVESELRSLTLTIGSLQIPGVFSSDGGVHVVFVIEEKSNDVLQVVFDASDAFIFLEICCIAPFNFIQVYFTFVNHINPNQIYFQRYRITWGNSGMYWLREIIFLWVSLVLTSSLIGSTSTGFSIASSRQVLLFHSELNICLNNLELITIKNKFIYK